MLHGELTSPWRLSPLAVIKHVLAYKYVTAPHLASQDTCYCECAVNPVSSLLLHLFLLISCKCSSVAVRPTEGSLVAGRIKL